MTSPEVISLAGLLSGALDLTATGTLVKTQGIPIERLLQTIASGALGPSAFHGGKRIATAGLLFHFLIAFAVASVYYAASRRMPIRLAHPLLAGSLYGVIVHIVMSCVVVPLSRVPKRKFSAKAFLTQLIIHMLCVGLPIALVVAYFAQ
jgi:hypothetical protein